eukprot:gene5275-biopygen4437
MHRHPRTAPAVFQVTITGPFNPRGPGDTPSRRAIYGSASVPPASDASHARAVLAPLLRRAYRRPIADDALSRPLQFFREAHAESLAAKASPAEAFEAGIESALAAILVAPQFLFRLETAPPSASGQPIPSGTAYRISDLELASRLSFFLWSSLPDEPLLAAAERGTLSQPAVLAHHVHRMLADPRAENLVTNFAAQWLHLRGLDAITPDARLFIDFDDNLR